MAVCCWQAVLLMFPHRCGKLVVKKSGYYFVFLIVDTSRTIASKKGCNTIFWNKVFFNVIRCYFMLTFHTALLTVLVNY